MSIIGGSIFDVHTVTKNYNSQERRRESTRRSSRSTIDTRNKNHVAPLEEDLKLRPSSRGPSDFYNEN